MIRVHIDESGTIGPKKNERYFVIAALITYDTASERRIKHLVKRTRANISTLENQKELKGSELSVPQKQKFLTSLMGTGDYSIAYLVMDKHNIDSRLYAQKNLTFNFLFGVLLKVILRDINGNVEICADNRTVKVGSLNSLVEYVQIQALTQWKFKYDLQLSLADSKTRNLLQAIDIIANSIWAKHNYNKKHLYGINKDRFIIRQHFPYTKFGK